MRRKGVLFALLLVISLLIPDAAFGQSRRKKRNRPKPSPKETPTKVTGGDKDDDVKSTTKEVGSSRRGQKEKLFDFEGLSFDGTTRMPQLLYFLDRANEELQRASLERRSFVPEMVRSVDEEAL